MSTVQHVRSIDAEALPWSERPLVQAAAGVAAFAIMTALAAEVRIPLPGTPVPVTLQTLFVLLAGAALGPAWGAASQVLYVSLRVAGVPWFSGPGGGLAALTGPTAGYLLGFVLAAGATGWLLDRGPRRMAWMLFSMLMATLILYASGIAWLLAGFRLSAAHAFLQGVVPFVHGDLLKIAVAAGLARAGDRMLVRGRQ